MPLLYVQTTHDIGLHTVAMNQIHLSASIALFVVYNVKETLEDGTALVYFIFLLRLDLNSICSC